MKCPDCGETMLAGSQTYEWNCACGERFIINRLSKLLEKGSRYEDLIVIHSGEDSFPVSPVSTIYIQTLTIVQRIKDIG